MANEECRATAPNAMRIFLSAVSTQFKACRDALGSDLRAVGAEVVVQEDFIQHGRTLLEKLEEYIASCDRVIALVGNAYGCEPDSSSVAADWPKRSYTQWEYCFAQGDRLDGSRNPARATYVYFGSPDFLAQHPIKQDPNAAERQQAFVTEIRRSGKDYNPFDSLDELRALVLRDGFRLAERAPQPRNLPYDSLGKLFKGRAAFLNELRQRLQGRPATAIVPKQVIHGLGGVGKTRAAVEYALAYENDYSALLFATADTPASLRRNLAALAALEVLDLPERKSEEEALRVAAVIRWLHVHAGWLLVLDNVDTREAAAAVEQTLAALSGGHVVITGRWSLWSASVEAVDLDVLTDEDAVAFLLERTAPHRRTTDTDAADARALAREVGGLGLALEQAGASVACRRISLGEYLRRWQKREEKVREWYDATLMKYPRSVAVTWDTTFNELDDNARALLQVLSWFAPEKLPRAVLDTQEAKLTLAAVTKPLTEVSEDPPTSDTEDALAALTGYSLLKWDSGNEAFRIHRLVQEITRERLPVGERLASLKAAVAVLNAHLEEVPPSWDEHSWPIWEIFRAHVTAVIASADAAAMVQETIGLRNQLSLLLMAKGLWVEAEPLLRRQLSILEESLGEHPDVATALNNLAQLLLATNRLDEAERLVLRAVTIDENSYTPDHPSIARDLATLAGLLQITDRLSAAEPLMRRVATIIEKAFGPNDSELATVLDNLAQLLLATNRLDEAERLLLRALRINEQSRGPDDVLVARILNSLAALFISTDRFVEAEPLLRRGVDVLEGTLGRSHPDLAKTLSNLARVLKATNRMEEAEAVYSRVVEILEQTFDGNHPDVGIALNNQAQLFQTMNRLAQAEDLLRRALMIAEQSYGSAHTVVAIRLNNLANLLRAAKRQAEAEPLSRRALEILLRSTVDNGHEHPHLREVAENYANLVSDTGLGREQVLAQVNEVTGPFGFRFRV